MDLIKAVGKLALEEGEQWRVEHPELMDAYQSCMDWRKLAKEDYNGTD